MRDERAAGAVPGPPSTGARTGAIGRTLGRIHRILSRRTSLLTCAILCVALLLVTSLPPVDSWHREVQTGLQSFASGGASAPPDYPYLFPPGEYPAPTNLSTWGVPSFVRLTTTPSGSDYMLFANDSGQALWLSSGAADPSDAKALVDGKVCLSGSGPTCVPTRSVYLTWSQPKPVWPATSGYTVTSDAITSVGATVVVGFSLSKSGVGPQGSEVYSSNNGGSSWVSLGSTPSGVVTSISANSQQVFLSSVDSGSLTVSTFSQAVPVASIDGSGTVRCTNGSCTATLTTHHAGDLIIAFCAMGTHSYTPTISDSGGLTWIARATNQSAAPGLYEFYAMAPTVLSSDSIKCAISVSGYNQDLIVFGIAGANPDSPFDPSSSVPASSYVSPDGGTPSATVSLSNSNDLLLGLLTVWDSGCGYPSPGSGFSLITTVGSPPCDQADYEATTTVGSHVVNYASTGSYPYAFIADAVEESSPSVTSVSLGTADAYQNASVVWTNGPTGGRVVAVASSVASGTVSTWSSANGGETWSQGTTVAAINETVPQPALDSIGQTVLVPPGGIPGQIATASVGSEIFVLYTTRINGRVQAATVVSPNGGSSWEGPYPVTIGRGSILDPTLAVSPTGEIEAAWRENGNSTWEVDQALFSPNGQLLGPPSALPASGGNSPTAPAAGPPVIGVDWLGRPIEVWTTTPSSGTPTIKYTGEFPSASEADSYLNTLLSYPLFPGDVPKGGSGGGQSRVNEFIANASSWVTSIGTVLSPKTLNLSIAQNDTTGRLSPNLTTFHVLVTTPGGPPAAPSVSLLAAESGPFTANYYFATYDEILLNAEGLSVETSPLTTGVEGSTAGPGVPTPSFTASTTIDGGTGSVGISVTPQSPSSVLVKLGGGTVPTYSTNHTGNCASGQGLTYWSNSTVAVSRGWTFLLLAGNDPSWTSGAVPYSQSGPNSLYLTNLTPVSNYTFDAWFNVTYQQTYTKDICGSVTKTTVSPLTVGPASGIMDIPLMNAWASTTLTILPNQPYMMTGNFLPTSKYVALTAGWNNTMLAKSGIWVNGTSVSNETSFTNSGFNITDVDRLKSLPTNQTYTVTVSSTSYSGGPNSSQTPDLSLGPSPSYPPEQASLSCGFNLTPPAIRVWWYGSDNWTINTSSPNTAQVEWNSNVSGLGMVTYYEYGVGQNLTIGNIPAVNVGKGNYTYFAVLHGLDLFATYSLTVGTGTGSGCLGKFSVGQFNGQTPHVLTLHEYDQPYDSITKQGGGAVIWWEFPNGFSERSVFENGTLQWSGDGTTVVIPITSQAEFGSPSWDMENLTLTLPQINSQYNVNLTLYYRQGSASLTVTSALLNFTYLKDTTGDGLTDQEKSTGWIVDTPSAPGAYLSASGAWVVEANPDLYATNGLVGDYVEKELGLDPSTIDTAGSHMLDTWNLTFDLGVGNASKPSMNASLPASGFEYWYENTSYFPFKSAGPITTGLLSNLTPNAPWITSGDGSPWASKVLWTGTGTGSALSQLEALISADNVGWLRAETGLYNGQRIMTVWGKLSWGANPVVQSTTGGSVPDGATINPLGQPDLNVTITSFSESGIASGDGVAVFIHSNSTKNTYIPGGQVNYNGYSVSAKSSGTSVSWSGSYTANFQVASTDQSVSLNLSVVTATSSKPTFTWHNASSLSIDLGNSSTFTHTFSGSGYSIGISYSVTDVFSKAPTTIIVPGDNSTLSSLPNGLKRYTGEQDFVLLEINETSTVSDTINGIPYVNQSAPNGISTAEYGLALYRGMNNLLIPRHYFETSLLGEALLNDTYQNATKLSYQGALEGNYNPDLWVARVTGATYNGVNYAAPSSGFIKVYSNTNQNCTAGSSECGTLPSDPAAEEQVPTYAIQAVIVLNISTLTDFSDLVAGLLLNTSGNFTGWGFTATPYLTSLGIESEVMGALANPFQFNSGAYGAPVYSGSSSSPSVWQIVGAAIWNAISGTVGTLLSVAWGWVQAAGAYAAYLVKEVSSWGLGIVSQTAYGLRAVASAIDWAVNKLVSILISTIESLFKPVVEPIESALDSYAAGLGSVIGQAWASENSTGGVSSGLVDDFWSALSGPVLVLALTIGYVVEVALVATTPFDLEGGFVIPILAALVSAGLAGFSGMPQITAFSSAGFDALRTFLVGLDPIPAIFVNQNLFTTLGILAAGTAGIAALIAFFALNTAVSSMKTDGIGAVVFFGALFAVAFLAFCLEVYGFINSSPELIILALSLSLLGAGVAGILVAEGAFPSLADYLFAILFSGGFSAGFDVGKLVSEG